jgi:hypothetical protein
MECATDRVLVARDCPDAPIPVEASSSNWLSTPKGLGYTVTFRCYRRAAGIS